MPIKVAYDISTLAADFGRPDAVTGINRVVSEVLQALSHRDDLEVTAVALAGEDPIDDCTKASLYLDNRKPVINCGFEYTYHQGSLLTTAYKSVFRAMHYDAPNGSTWPHWRAASLRYSRSALHRLAYYHRLVFPDRAFARNRFDVFHCPHWKVPPREFTGTVPRVFTVYDLIPLVRPDFVDSYFPAVFEKLLKRIDIDHDWVLCISEFTKSQFCERTGMSADRVWVTPLAADQSFHAVTDRDVIATTRARYAVPEGDYLLCLAAPQPRKNLSHLIRSFFRLLDAEGLPDTHLVLAGSKGQGWMYDETYAAAENSRHRSRLTFTGYVAEEDLAALYSGASGFVFPSLFEGFGLPALEAMACGTPVIASNTTSLPEVVGDAALLVDPEDPNQLAAAMFAILTDRALREELRRKGLARASQFSWRKSADLTAAMYRVAAAGGTRASSIVAT